MELITGLLTGWGAILLSVFMVLTVALKWPNWLHYIWALLVLASGVLSM
ncbi:MAG: hypothetical protein G01um101433_11 [Parcubacteria group bacterium Gr01-1014_33]|nr:MAG: hypothetical protein G01um101433_11 [Parcubacteria group bacterium Gr01-1014_33]